ncbi:hypothetical protein Ae201684_001189 [Aphanomyces euteiches]|uniref:Uncharacterized protein n=1 Tax=Aphanomyces euteiches TaxID=100861 RepID=A0A6G0XW15_9STRA|nr:hypothetical protein Ae201684_001189 [Aphanomyces euteiches]
MKIKPIKLHFDRPCNSDWPFEYQSTNQVKCLPSSRMGLARLVVRASEHVTSTDIGFFFFFFLGGFSSSRGSTTSRGSRASSSGESRRISQVSLERIGLFEREVFQFDGNGDQRLEGVGQRVRDRGQSRETQSQREGSNVAETTSELFDQVFFGQVQDSRVEDGTVVVDGLDDQTVRERTDVQLLEQHGFGVTDLFTLLGQQDIGHDFNLTLLNLGTDLQSLEKGGLTGVATSRTSRAPHIDRGNSTDTSRGRDLVGFQSFTDLVQVFVGEDETNIALQQRNHGFQRMARVLLHVVGEDLADHGVLAHQDFSLAAQSDTDLLDLVRANVVNTDDEDLVVGVQQVFQLGEVFGLAFHRDTHLELFTTESSLTWSRRHASEVLMTASWDLPTSKRLVLELQYDIFIPNNLIFVGELL